MRRASLLGLITAVALALSACASGPRFDRDRYDDAIAPAQAARGAETLEGTGVLWGGLIVAASNLEAGTEIEVLAYPLQRSQRPDTSRPPLGRFLASTPEYLETVDFAEGRLITVAGTLAGTREGRVGAARYVYPVVETGPGQIHLWPIDSRTSAEPRFSFGVGVMLGR